MESPDLLHIASSPIASVAPVRVWTFIVAGSPLLALDLPDTAHDVIMTRLLAGGLTAESGFFGALPSGTPPTFGLTLSRAEAVLEDDNGDPLVKLPSAAVAGEWRDRALERRGSLFYVSRDLATADDASAAELCTDLHAAGERDSLFGAIIGVAHPKPTLPIFFG